MNLDINILPENETASPVDAALASPMSKNQRRLSLSAKWANDKALAFEYLKRQREVVIWMEQILDKKLSSTDLHESLRSGIVLRELLEKLFPDTTHSLSAISRSYSLRMAPWKERENISVFLKQCKALGMNDLSLFCTDDLYDGNNMVQVMFCIQDFMRFSQEHSGHFLHPVYDEHVSFSSQEVEMAMSKIEKAGMDATKLKELMNGSSAGPSSGVRGKSGSEDDTDADSLLAGSDTEHDLPDSDEKVLDELEDELQALAGNEESSCHQPGDDRVVAEDSDEDCEPDAVGKVEGEEGEEGEEGGESEYEEDGDEAEAEAEVEVEVEVEAEVEAEVEVEVEVEEGESEEYEFDDDEKEIIVLLNDIADALEEELEGEEDKLEGKEEEELPIEHEADAKRAAVQEADLEDARRAELPAPTASEIMEPDVLMGILGKKPCIETEKDHAELMDLNKLEVLAVPDAERSGYDQGENGTVAVAAASSDAKPSKKKLRLSRKKKNREVSDEQLEAEVMARCTCGKACSIM